MKIVLSLAIIIVFSLGVWRVEGAKHTTTQATKVTATTQLAKQVACKTNTLSQLVIVSINNQHLWACNGTSQVFDSAVITGNEDLASDLTPIGVYKIYSKLTNVSLTGSNGNTSWNDFVNYDMPFLRNQYGHYDFHDATWRASSDFGHINPHSSNASHGCVEMPLNAASRLYNWATVGTTIKIES